MRSLAVGDGKITAEMVDMPCPKCGSNLLTEADWVAWQPYSILLSEAAKLPVSGDELLTEFRVGLHGSTTKIEFGPASDKERKRSSAGMMFVKQRLQATQTECLRRYPDLKRLRRWRL